MPESGNNQGDVGSHVKRNQSGGSGFWGKAGRHCRIKKAKK
jgi:hypothetical protein